MTIDGGELDEMLTQVLHVALRGYGPTQYLRDIAGTAKMDELRKLVRMIYDAGREDGGQAWHDAVLDECMVRESCYVPDDPKKTLLQLFQWETSAALDPAISEPAQELRYRTAETVLQYAAILMPPDKLKALTAAVALELTKPRTSNG